MLHAFRTTKAGDNNHHDLFITLDRNNVRWKKYKKKFIPTPKL